MPRGLTYLVDDDNQVLLVRIIGAHSGADILDFLRELPTRQPRLAVYALIADIRQWEGTMSDEEFTAQLKWIHAFREQHGLTAAVSMVILGLRGSALEIIAAQARTLRGAPIQVAFSVPEAWECAAPDRALPKSAISFLR